MFSQQFFNLHRRWQISRAAIYIINLFHDARPWLPVCTLCTLCDRKLMWHLGGGMKHQRSYMLHVRADAIKEVVWGHYMHKYLKKAVTFKHFALEMWLVGLKIHLVLLTVCKLFCQSKDNVMSCVKSSSDDSVYLDKKSATCGKCCSIAQGDYNSCNMHGSGVFYWSKSIL